MSIIHDVHSSIQQPIRRAETRPNAVESLLSRKRKRAEVVATPSALPASGQFSFIIRPHDSQPPNNETPQSYRSLLSITRSQLPLTFLDNPNTATRLFSAHLPLLEDAAEQSNQNGPKILIVRHEQEPNGSLYAVERVKSNVYILCKLGNWVRVDHVKSLKPALATRQDTPLDDMKQNDAKTSSSAWWQTCLASEPSRTAPPASSSRKAPRLSMARPESFGQGQKIVTSQTKTDHTAIITAPEPVEVETVPTSAEDVFDRFINQYLETLYLSRTPLAFFAKGPVSRTRAAFTSGQMEASSIAHLTPFLRSMIQSSSTADKKYKDELPGMLQKVSSRGVDDESSPVKEKKKRKKRRLKPDKCGILPDEDDFFEKWWHGDETTSVPADETAEQCLKRRSAQLRTRETFMQLILVLEVLSLDAMPDVKTNTDAESQAHASEGTPQAEKDESQQKSTKTKSKKTDDLSLLLELLIDKLCIWHSLDTDLMLDENSIPAKDKKSPNELRNFCIEVVIPFYLSRTPDHAANANKKLGGPTPSATTKPKPGSSTHRSKPADLERGERKPRRPLHRVATEIATSSKRPGPPSLRHSVTDPLRIKREVSEALSLSQIPSFREASVTSQNPPQTGSRRSSGIAHLRAREVDFTSLKAANDAKLKKKKEIDEKIKEAIHAIKKPNRATVSKESADVAEQRRLMANARARGPVGKGKAGAREKEKEREKVSVAATPRNDHRSQHVVAATPHHIAGPSFMPRSQPPLPLSGPSCIPSSTMKPPAAMPSKSLSQIYSRGSYSIAEVEEDTYVPATGRTQRTVRYEITPTKRKMASDTEEGMAMAGFGNMIGTPTGSNLASHPADTVPGTVERSRRVMSPLLEGIYDDDYEDDAGDERVGAAMQTPSKPSRSFHFQETPSRSADRRVVDFRASTTAAAHAIVSTPIKALVREKEQEQLSSAPGGNNLYDALGWNDDFSD